MALSLGWHIVIACFGVGMPAITVFSEWRALRSGDEAYGLLVYRWAKAMGVLFAVGAVSGTILSFEMGVLWPGLMSTYGQVIGLPFTMEGFAFFIEAIFLGVYLYAWDRLPPRAHLLTGIPVCVAGVASAAVSYADQMRGAVAERPYLRGALALFADLVRVAGGVVVVDSCPRRCGFHGPCALPSSATSSRTTGTRLPRRRRIATEDARLRRPSDEGPRPPPPARPSDSLAARIRIHDRGPAAAGPGRERSTSHPFRTPSALTSARTVQLL